jgi:hypothetical protein
LSMKWPQVVRWLYWNPNDTDVKLGLEKLEKSAEAANGFADWKKIIRSMLQLDEKDTAVTWADDEGLMNFFKLEVTTYKEAPLSAGAGKGLY